MNNAGPGLAEEPATTVPRRVVPDWIVALGILVVGAIGYAIPYLQNRYFYYVGDGPEGYLPLWHEFGEHLRAGQWPTMEPSSWFAGQYAAESATAMWNPVALLSYLVVTSFDDLAAAAAVVEVGYLSLLAVAVFLLARAYGARQVPAIAVGLAVPAAGFTMYYEAAGWPGGLMAFTWITWFWWSALRYSRGTLPPVVPFLLGLMAMTTGNPYAALGAIIVLFGITVELLVGREFRRLGHLVVTGVCVGAAGALVFLPLVGTLEVSARQELAMIANDMFMVPDLGDLAASSSPTYLPSIVNWNGAVLESLPSTYFAWFVVPLLPWLRWGSLRPRLRSLTSLGAIILAYGVLVLGPSNVWLFRWPIRLVEYLYLGLAVLFAVLLSAGLTTERFKERALVTGGLVGVGAYLSFANRPEFYRMHLLASAAVLVLVLGAVLAYRHRGWPAMGAVLVIGTIGVLTYQTGRIPTPLPPGATGYEPPRSVSRLEAGTADYLPPVLQLAAQSGVRTQDSDDGEILFGNLTRGTGQEWLNRYSGIGFAEFTAALCMDYKGAVGQVCPGSEAYRRLWRPYPGTDIELVDALRVQTLVMQNSLLPAESRRTPPDGWRVLDRDDVHTVWVRDQPIDIPGRVSWTSSGVEVLGSDDAAQREQVRYRADGDGGELLFARLAWPGYTATVDGRPVDIQTDHAGLIRLDVPAGEHVVDLRYASPGLRLGAWVLLGAALVVFAQTVLWFVTRRRSAGAAALTDGPVDTTGTDPPDTPARDTAEPARELAVAGRAGPGDDATTDQR